jgi:hypothetical protein
VRVYEVNDKSIVYNKARDNNVNDENSLFEMPRPFDLPITFLRIKTNRFGFIKISAGLLKLLSFELQTALARVQNMSKYVSQSNGGTISKAMLICGQLVENREDANGCLGAIEDTP